MHAKDITFDEALIKRVGQFGRGQMTLLAAASLCLLANAAAFFFLVFAATNPITHHQWQCVDTGSNTACQAVKQQEVPSIQDFCALPPGSTEWTSHDSIIAQFSLVCNDAWKVQFANSLMFMGALLGSGAFGFACDRWGRKQPLYVATALIAVSMYASLAASNYWALAALRAVTGFGAAGQSHCNFLLSTEGVGPAYRGLAGICALAFFIVGEFVMVALGFALSNWRHLLLACASINAATLLLYPFVRESGRWLLSKGRTEEAKQFLQYLATANKSQVPPEPLVSSRSKQQLMPDLESQDVTGGCDAADSASSSATSSTGSSVAGDAFVQDAVTLMQLLRRPRLAVRLLILLITSFSIMLSYYGISLGTGGMPGSIYMTFAIGSAAEAVAISLVAPSVDRLGRHNIIAVGQLLGGAACLACGLVKGGTTQAALAAIGKFGCSAASSVCNTYIAELLPTSCRSSVLGITTQASRLGSIAAPFLLMMGAQVSVGNFSQVFIPFMVFGCLAVLSGLLVLTMPETLGAAMPENVEDLENLLSVFAAKPWRRGCGALVAFMFSTTARAASPFSAAGTGAGSPDSSTISACSGSSEGTGLDAVRVYVVAGSKLAPSKDVESDTQQASHNNS